MAVGEGKGFAAEIKHHKNLACEMSLLCPLSEPRARPPPSLMGLAPGLLPQGGGLLERD